MNNDNVNIIYLRVSTKDKDQDPEQQLRAIQSKYKIQNYKLMQDVGSAYNLAKISKRQQFLELLNICFNCRTLTFENFFLSKYEKKHINLYVWDYSRIIRHLEFNIILSILATKFNININSYKDTDLLKANPNETPTAKFTRMMLNAIVGYSAEEYSYTISQNTKKAYSGGYSSKGKKWGKGYHKADGSRVIFTIDQEKQFKAHIKKLLRKYERKEVIDIIRDTYNISITHSWISRNYRD